MIYIRRVNRDEDLSEKESHSLMLVIDIQNTVLAAETWIFLKLKSYLRYEVIK